MGYHPQKRPWIHEMMGFGKSTTPFQNGAIFRIYVSFWRCIFQINWLANCFSINSRRLAMNLLLMSWPGKWTLECTSCVKGKGHSLQRIKEHNWKIYHVHYTSIPFTNKKQDSHKQSWIWQPLLDALVLLPPEVLAKKVKVEWNHGRWVNETSKESKHKKISGAFYLGNLKFQRTSS